MYELFYFIAADCFAPFQNEVPERYQAHFPAPCTVEFFRRDYR